jgi:iron(III) transport system ATP-binding protein
MTATSTTLTSGAPAIEVANLSIRYGSVTAVESVSFAVEAGHQLTLLGPSGCGKTSTMRAVAGLEKPTSGGIRIGGRTIFDSAKGVNIPAEQRGMSMVFQSYAIWPHMTVFDNVAYGLRVRKVTGAQLKEKVHHALDLVKMGAYAERNASALSGGQQQRVALARAVAFSPPVLLFDEPLSNLDAKLRSEMRIELRELQRRLGVTSLYVTHDLEEALAMSDHIVVMRAGLIEQSGPPAEIYNYPRTAFVADFVGSANLITGDVIGQDASTDTIVLKTADGLKVQGVTRGRTVGKTATFSLRTVHLALTKERPLGDINVWPVTVLQSVFLGDTTQIHVLWGQKELVARQHGPIDARPGEQAYLHAAVTACALLEP